MTRVGVLIQDVTWFNCAAPSLVFPSEKPTSLEEVVDLKAAVALVVTVATMMPAAMTAAQQAREAVRCDAAQNSLRERVAQHAAARAAVHMSSARRPSARRPSPAAEQLAQQARLLLMRLGRRPRQVVGVLQAVVYTVLVQVDEVVALLLRLLAMYRPNRTRSSGDMRAKASCAARRCSSGERCGATS